MFGRFEEVSGRFGGNFLLGFEEALERFSEGFGKVLVRIWEVWGRFGRGFG